MTGTDASYHRPALTGQSIMPDGSFSLLSFASGAWVNVTGFDLLLPEPGTYKIEADVRGAINGNAPFNVHIHARLANVTAGVAIPNTERFVVQVGTASLDGHIESDNDTVPITAVLTVAVPTTVRLQASRTDEPASAPASSAGIFSDANGRTVLRYTKL